MAGLVGSARGVPDISMSAAVDGAALVYLDAGAAAEPRPVPDGGGPRPRHRGRDGSTNTVTFPPGGIVHTVRGWDAVKGYDLASGVGMIDAALFVPELAAASK